MMMKYFMSGGEIYMFKFLFQMYWDFRLLYLRTTILNSLFIIFFKLKKKYGLKKGAI